MTAEVACCYDDNNLAHAEQIMLERNVRRLPVLHRGTKEVIGMISIDDIAFCASRERAGRVLQATALPAKSHETTISSETAQLNA